MEAQHTPGPWQIGHYKASPDAHPIFDSFGSWGLAQANWPAGIQHSEVLANQLLIAAAPEMFDALTALIATARKFRDAPNGDRAWTSGDNEVLDEAVAAIATARGQSLPAAYLPHFLKRRDELQADRDMRDAGIKPQPISVWSEAYREMERKKAQKR